MRLLPTLAAWTTLCVCGCYADPFDYRGVRWDGTQVPLPDPNSCAVAEAGFDFDPPTAPVGLGPWSNAATNPWGLGPTGRTFYVRPDGDDDAAGDAWAFAWRSIARVNQEQLAPGDRVLFQAGSRFAGTLVLDARDAGSALAPIGIGSFGEGRATIDAGAGSAIRIGNTGGFAIEDLNLNGGWDAETQSGSADDSAGIVAENTLGGGQRLRFLRIRRLEISGFKAAGIRIAAAPEDDGKNAGFEGVEISDSDVHDNGDVGIASSGPFTRATGYSHRAFLIKGVRVYRNRGLVAKTEHTGSGIMLADVDGALVESCTAYENGEFNDSDAGGGFGIWAWDSNAVVIQHSEAYANHSQTADGGGFDLDGGVTNSVVQYNYSHDNHGAGFGVFQFAFARPAGGNVVRYNISQNDGMAFLLWDGNGDLEGFDLVHNVGYGERPVVMSYSPLRAVRLLNNIFYGVGETLLDIASAEGLTFQGNDYWNEGGPLAIAWNTLGTTPAHFGSLDQFRSATGQEARDGVATGLEVDPELRDPGGAGTLGDGDPGTYLAGYTLDRSSPLIGRGVELADYGIEPGCTDFFGNSLSGQVPPSIGAHERP
jgi:hypothetical protein